MTLWHAQGQPLQRRWKTTIETHTAVIQKTEICSSVDILLADVVAKGLGVLYCKMQNLQMWH
jgi:hypothetical protein